MRQTSSNPNQIIIGLNVSLGRFEPTFGTPFSGFWKKRSNQYRQGIEIFELNSFKVERIRSQNFSYAKMRVNLQVEKFSEDNLSSIISRN